MNIEFHSPAEGVSNSLIDHVRNELIQLHHIDKSVSRAEVIFREAPTGEKVCELRLSVFSDNIYIHRTAPTFTAAAAAVLKMAHGYGQEHVARQSEPQSVITSSVRV
jgi:hypothetical protein